MAKLSAGSKLKHVRIGYDVWRRARMAALVLECGLGEFCEGAIEARLSGMESRGVDVGASAAEKGRKVVEVGWKKPEGVEAGLGGRSESLTGGVAPGAQEGNIRRSVRAGGAAAPPGSAPSVEPLAETLHMEPQDPTRFDPLTEAPESTSDRLERVLTTLPTIEEMSRAGQRVHEWVGPDGARLTSEQVRMRVAEQLAAETFQPETAPLDEPSVSSDGLGPAELFPNIQKPSAVAPADSRTPELTPAGAGAVVNEREAGGGDRPVEPLFELPEGYTLTVTDGPSGFGFTDEYGRSWHGTAKDSEEAARVMAELERLSKIPPEPQEPGVVFTAPYEVTPERHVVDGVDQPIGPSFTVGPTKDELF